jgi:hypothetical protein
MQPNKSTSRSTARPVPPRRGSGAAAARPSVPVPLIVGGLIAVALIAVIVLAVMQTLNERAEESRPIEGLQAYSNLDRGHRQGLITYDQIPPAGGVHNPSWQNCGVYTSPIQNEYAVHSLEHGAVWITYQPDLDIDQVRQLQGITRQSTFRLLSPYPDLPSPIVISAWGYQLALDSAEDERLMQFIRKYEQSPYAPEPGAACIGGVGQPG